MFKHRLRGFASIPLLVFMLVVVTFVITQAHYTTSARFGDDLAQSDSAAAFFLAETGIDSGVALLATAADQGEFDAACNKLKAWETQGSTNLGRGAVNYAWQAATSDTVAEVSSCTYRATGQVNQAKRTLEKLVEYTVQKGIAGFSEQESPGSKITVTPVLRVKSSKAAVAILTSAYRVNGSAGYDAILTDGVNANADLVCAADPTNPKSCALQWDVTSSGGGSPSVGSITVAKELYAGATIEISQKIYAKGGSTVPTPRNYVQVGALVQGASPSIEGNYGQSGDTTNTSASATSTGTFVNGSTSGSLKSCSDSVSGKGLCACYKSDVLVFAVAGRVDPATLGTAYSAAFDQIIFDTDTSGYAIPMKLLQHYPSTTEATQGAQGDIFAEMWYSYNPYLDPTTQILGVSTSATNPNNLYLTVQSTAEPIAGTYIRLFNDCVYKKNSCNFAPQTKIITPDFTKTTKPAAPKYLIEIPKPSGFTLADLTAAWVTTPKSAICGGICAYQKIPSLAGGKTAFQVKSIGSKTANQWAGGFMCLQNVGQEPTSSISRQQVAGRRWREISSEDQ